MLKIQQDASMISEAYKYKDEAVFTTADRITLYLFPYISDIWWYTWSCSSCKLDTVRSMQWGGKYVWLDIKSDTSGSFSANDSVGNIGHISKQ